MRTIEGGWPKDATIVSTLPGRYYTDPTIFKLELDKIWLDTWLCAGHPEQLPRTGDYLSLDVGDENILVVRNRSGGISAFYNVCRHRGSRFCTEETGTFRSGMIRCPYHSWTYDSGDGALVVAPNVPDDAGLNRTRLSLFPVRVELWAGFIWINANPNAQSLAACFGLPASYTYYERYHLSELTLGKLITYKTTANWKIVMDNAYECFHCPHIHPEFSKCLSVFGPRLWLHTAMPESQVFRHAGGLEFAPGFHAMNLDGKPRRPQFPGLSERDTTTSYFVYVYPHVFIGHMPDYAYCFTVWPLTVSTTRVCAYWVFAPDVMAREGFDGSDAVEFWDITNRQDLRASELAHRGNQSRMYRDGGVLVQNEWRVSESQRYVLERLGHDRQSVSR